MKICHYSDLRVYRLAENSADRIFDLSKDFPEEERYSLTSQIRKSSRAVRACIGEAWRRRRYPANFVAKLNDAEAEAEETRIWLDFVLKCKYAPPADATELSASYDRVQGQLVNMIRDWRKWTLPVSRPEAK